MIPPARSLAAGERNDAGRAEAAVRQALVAIPGFSPADVQRAELVRLRGLTNLVYKVEIAGALLCLRIPGRGTATIIDRHAEELNARAAAEAEVAPPVLYFGADGVMLTPFLTRAVTLSPELLRTRRGAVERVARAFRRLHEGTPPFTREFQAFATIDKYVGVLAEHGAELPADLPAILKSAARIRDALAAHPVEPRPCHCDPTGANMLDDGERVLLIDWEYSAMNDPMWDLAYLSLEAEFDAAMDEYLLHTYSPRPSAGEADRMALYKPVSELLSALWALIQGESCNRAADFAAYADAKLRSTRMLMRSAGVASAAS